MTPDQAYFTPLPLRTAAKPRQTLHLSTRKSCSDNRDQLSVQSWAIARLAELTNRLAGANPATRLSAISRYKIIRVYVAHLSGAKKPFTTPIIASP
jgi:hypothetical protein